MPERHPTRVYFDANVFIYAMETDGEQGVLARRWLSRVERREVVAVTSEITLAEVLPHPVARNDLKLIDGYKRLLSERSPIEVCPVDRETLLDAVQLRAQDRSAIPDAVHVATAVRTACEVFLTEDERLKVPTAITKRALSEPKPAP